MRQLQEAKKTSATIPIRAARIYASDLQARGGATNNEVARQLQGCIAIAELSGQSRVDIEASILEAFAPEIEMVRIDASIQEMIDLVIDLRP